MIFAETISEIIVVLWFGSVQKKSVIFNHTSWLEQKLEMEEYKTLDILNWRKLCSF